MVLNSSVTPSLMDELMKQGVKIGEPEPIAILPSIVRKNIAFVKKLKRGYAVVVELSKEDNKIMLHKTFFYKDSEGKRIPYKNKPSIKEKWSEDGSTSISPADNQHLADTENISALDHISDGKDNTNISNTQGKSFGK